MSPFFFSDSARMWTACVFSLPQRKLLAPTICAWQCLCKSVTSFGRANSHCFAAINLCFKTLCHTTSFPATNFPALEPTRCKCSSSESQWEPGQPALNLGSCKTPTTCIAVATSCGSRPSPPVQLSNSSSAQAQRCTSLYHPKSYDREAEDC